ncbi:hypothetical protein [Catellatospora sp. NPDC049133]|uniref:hypothetical protein n=1 Tax=Catellatospora sp. NPDC049133 TaxID=3155499 RepID=UPI0033C7B536
MSSVGSWDGPKVKAALFAALITMPLLFIRWWLLVICCFVVWLQATMFGLMKRRASGGEAGDLRLYAQRVVGAGVGMTAGFLVLAQVALVFRRAFEFWLYPMLGIALLAITQTGIALVRSHYRKAGHDMSGFA